MSFDFYSTAEEVTENVNLKGQYWLVTGVNSGLGYETTRVLGMRGATVIALARTLVKAEETLAELKVEGIPVACDLSDLQSVTQAIQQIHELGLPIQGMIANAGIMALPTVQQRNGIELQFYTNHVGHFHLVNGLVDRLVDNGRVVILSSRAHYYALERGLELDNLSGEKDYHDWRLYGRSKLANILYAKSLNLRFLNAGSQRRANAVHPGVIPTNLARHIENSEAMYKKISETIPLKTIPQGAATQCFVATHPSLEGVGGMYFSDCQIADTIPQAQDMALAAELWAITEEIIHKDL